jgi:hypothetical protein
MWNKFFEGDRTRGDSNNFSTPEKKLGFMEMIRGTSERP